MAPAHDPAAAADGTPLIDIGPLRRGAARPPTPSPEKEALLQPEIVR